MHGIETPIGPLLLSAEGGRLSGVSFADSPHARSSDPVLLEAEAQLHDYFAGRLQRFELPLAPRGTDFQLSVWQALLELPYGSTSTYSKLAAVIGRPSACRAVGAANGRNPLAVIVPCHRVIGASGELTGYGGGLERKRVLLALEAGKGRESQHGREEPAVGATV